MLIKPTKKYHITTNSHHRFKKHQNLITTLEYDKPEQVWVSDITYKQTPLIHHSDRGLQYYSNEYQRILDKNNIRASMTQKYDPYENAIAERVNGILKQEFDVDKYDMELKMKKKLVKNAIEIYNSFRPHLSNKMLTPNQMHQQNKLKREQYKNKKGSNRKLLPLIY